MGTVFLLEEAEGTSYFFLTVTVIFAVFLPAFTVIVALPAFLALITPLLVTVATFL